MILKTLLFLFLLSKAHALSYEHIWHTSASVHIVIANPKEHTFVPVKAKGRETVQALTDRYQATAAINGGFWRENGEPAGILKIDGIWHGLPIKPRGAIGWATGQASVYMDRVLTNASLEVIPLLGTTSKQWAECDHIVGGTPLLIWQGQVLEEYSSEQTLLSFLTNKHARTALGTKSNGDWVFVVVDAFPLGGMTIPQLAHLLKELGCIQALNLDGGGSSTLVIKKNVINAPKKFFAEAVSDAILIF